ncbi:MAG TPA: hypothetical protein VMG82_32025 [Candidatus Sulfotelmatobacter sp.]|nr:hypothetical protein [Candidatus Sulfotelmatobacter sp.]
MHAAPDQRAVAKSKIGILLFISCCLLSTGRVIVEAPWPGHIHSDDISKRSDLRFAELKPHLPAKGIVGYLGEPGDSAIPDYYLTQYALAPLVVDFSPSHTIVVGNFPFSPPLQLPENLRLVRDFGNGVMLFASKDTK